VIGRARADLPEELEIDSSEVSHDHTEVTLCVCLQTPEVTLYSGVCRVGPRKKEGLNLPTMCLLFVFGLNSSCGIFLCLLKEEVKLKCVPC